MKSKKNKTEKAISKIVSEPYVSYENLDLFSGIIALLGGERLIKHKINKQLDWVDLIRIGLPGNVINVLAKNISFTEEEISNVIHISTRSLQRWTKETKNKILDRETSAKTIALATLFSKGANVFGSIEAFKQWLRLSNSALENKKPIELLDTSIGFELINDELGKIEYGIFA